MTLYFKVCCIIISFGNSFSVYVLGSYLVTYSYTCTNNRKIYLSTLMKEFTRVSKENRLQINRKKMNAKDRKW